MVCPLELRIYRTEHPSIHGRGALLFFVSCGADFEKQKLQDLRIALRLARGLYALYPIASRFCMSFLQRLESARMPIGLLDGAVSSAAQSANNCSVKRCFFRRQLASFRVCKLPFAATSEPFLLTKHLRERDLTVRLQYLLITHAAHFWYVSASISVSDAMI